MILHKTGELIDPPVMPEACFQHDPEVEPWRDCPGPAADPGYPRLCLGFRD